MSRSSSPQRLLAPQDPYSPDTTAADRAAVDTAAAAGRADTAAAAGKAAVGTVPDPHSGSDCPFHISCCCPSISPSDIPLL